MTRQRALTLCGLLALVAALCGAGTPPAAATGAAATAYDITDLGTLGGPISRATNLNARGQVVGGSTSGPGQQPPFGPGNRAFLWENGRMADLGTLGGAFSLALGINAAGQVVGVAATGGGDRHAFLWQGGRMADLGTLPNFPNSQAYLLNTTGQIPGYASTAGGPGGPQRALLWDKGTLVDLNSLLPASSGWELVIALAINDAGQIAGGGLIRGEEHAYLLTPSATTMPGLPSTGGGSGSAQAPLPAALLGGLGLALLLGGSAPGSGRRHGATR